MTKSNLIVFERRSVTAGLRELRSCYGQANQMRDSLYCQVLLYTVRENDYPHALPQSSNSCLAALTGASVAYWLVTLTADKEVSGRLAERLSYTANASAETANSLGDWLTTWSFAAERLSYTANASAVTPDSLGYVIRARNAELHCCCGYNAN
ncbi:unnamed protein product [Chrysodeixis includens]|uniref:Uncharacterized protein n=1 Tax=Chrysodeixis includens TaxID=689277 RepID=A0A9N8KT40_CHRIL|nr:unnamed protein product [Chrysodeixis includens]